MVDPNLGLIVLAAFFLLVLLRAPVFVALAAPSIAYFLWTGFPPSFVAQRMVRVIDSFTLLAVPMYIFLGSLLNHGDIADRIFDFANDLIGHFPSGLAHVNILTSLIFSGMSGAALADIGGVGRILIDEMKARGYSPGYAAAITSASATVGPIFPPSIPLIIFGLLAQVSIISLFLAGIAPAILTVMLLAVGSIIIASLKEFPRSDARASFRTVRRSAYRSLPAIVAPVLLVGGLLAGLFSAIEAAVVTIGYMIVINALFYRILEVGYIWEAAKEAVRITATIIVIIATAGLFSRVMTLEGIDNVFAGLLFSVSGNTLLILLLVNVFLLLLGLFLEPIAAMVMSIPIVMPPLVEVGVDPVHVGIIMVFNLMIGLLTPPLGLSLFIAADLADADLSEILSEIKEYYLILLIALVLITFVPTLSLYIPAVVSG